MKAYKELLFLSRLNGVGPSRICRSYTNILERGIEFQELCDLVLKVEPEVDEENVSKASKFAHVAYESIVNRSDIYVYTILDKEYPAKLMDLGIRAPLTIHIKGDISLLSKPSVAIIGTREPCEWSKKIEPRMVGKILEYGDYVITSGLALGCESIGHESCIANSGKTVAVLPSGFDHIYPADNVELSQRILESGGTLISEYAPIEKTTRYSFIARDTIIAALSEAIFVIECGSDNGTMHIVDAGSKLNRLLAVYNENNSRKWKGYYNENRKLIAEKLAREFSDTSELFAVLSTIDMKDFSAFSPQITLFDFL